jgi:diaminopimelate epimerase
MRGFPFFKMSGSGNDFILMDHREVPWQEWDLPEVARRLCRRRLSIGADGLILLMPAKAPRNDFSWRFLNADGSEAEMCGNGARCAARFAFMQGLAGRRMRFETLSGVIEAEVGEGSVRVRMGDPGGIRRDLTVLTRGDAYPLVFMDTGVPHAVSFVEDVEGVDVAEVGRSIRHHEAFAPRGTNADFVQVVDRHTVKMRTYERGVEGETLACGTGAVASAVAAHIRGDAVPPVTVITRSGLPLVISFQEREGNYTDVYLEGDARLVYRGVATQEAWE